MSGTSLDGLDIAHCTFQKDENWSFVINESATIPYPELWQERLRSMHLLNGELLTRLHLEYGRYLGQSVRGFMEASGLDTDFISSHGHTIFHQPQEGFTFQAGAGCALAAVSGLPVVCDFRSSDVILGGQGAPLVPIGDRMLFSEFEYCLNLGGIANISFEDLDKRIAFDVSPCNLLLNSLANRLGYPYDEGGRLALSGNVVEHLLEKLNASAYYQKPPPKSLGREDIERDFIPLFSDQVSVEDQMTTVCTHIGQQIARSVSGPKGQKILATGGGAWNEALIRSIAEFSGLKVIVPERRLVDFKEALVFAFLGLLRWRGENNVLSSVTGSSRDHSAGAVYLT